MRCFLGEVQKICEFIISTRSSLSDDAPQETQRPLFIFTGPIEIFTHPHTKGPLESLQMTTTRSMQLRAHQDNSHFTGRAHPHVPWRSIIIFILITNASLKISSLPSKDSSWRKHEQGVVEHHPILSCVKKKYQKSSDVAITPVLL